MVAFTSLHIRSICLLLFTLISPNSHAEKNACPEGKNIAPYFGTYKVINAIRYRGGLTTEAEAKENIEKKTILSEKLFSIGIGQVSLSNPVYKLKCYKQLKEEGNVPLSTERWSNFYGFGMNRKIIKILEIYDAQGNIKDFFELITHDEIWNTFDGFLYKMKKSSVIQNKTFQ